MKNNWTETNLISCLSDVLDYRGKTPKKMGGDWSESGILALSALNIKFDGLVNLDSARFVDEELYNRWMKKEVVKGDILLTSEAPSGQVYLWNSDEKIVLSQRLFALRTNEKVYNKYLKYYLQSEIGQAEIFRNNSGSTVAGISAKTFKNIIVKYPCYSEQVKIGDFLYNLDEKISLNNKIMNVIQDFIIQTYWALVSKNRAEGSISKCKLSDLVTLQTENIIPSNLNDVIPYVGLEHISKKNLFLMEHGTSDQANSTKTIFEKYDILLCKIRPYLHKVCIPFLSGITSTDSIVIRANSKKNLSVILNTIFSDIFIDLAVKSSSGSKMPRADWNTLKDYEIEQPNSGDLEQYNQSFYRLLELCEVYFKENIELKALRDRSLSLLMNGQISIKDAEEHLAKTFE
ncbi:restriction endonuclease subunit S [Acinetobacter johnsonii]|uniref:restriction endonuclease subunit S n=1 Tax=Acinetobacter johnsonii TaxID=40214 RepID=UPI003AF41B4E